MTTKEETPPDKPPPGQDKPDNLYSLPTPCPIIDLHTWLVEIQHLAPGMNHPEIKTKGNAIEVTW